MRALLVVTALAISTSGAAQPERTTSIAVPADEPELAAEAGRRGWNVSIHPAPEGETFEERVASARQMLASAHAFVWCDSDGAVLVAVVSTEEEPRTSPVPSRELVEREVAIALALDRVLSNESTDVPSSTQSHRASPERITTPVELPEAEEVPSPRQNRWSSPLARNRWMIRLGWFWGASPRSRGGFGAHVTNAPTVLDISAGFRARVGRWLTRNLRVDMNAHVGKTWHGFGGGGVESGLNFEVMAVSDTRLRMGAGLGFGALMVGERDASTGNLFGWTGWWASLPMEVGFDFFRSSGLFVHVGPTLTRPPYTERAQPGLMMSVEGEIDLGTFD